MSRTRIVMGSALVLAMAAFMIPAAGAAAPDTANHGTLEFVAHASTPVRGGSARSVPGYAARPGKTSNGISYHNGPVMTNGVNAYLIWYGNWSGNTATTILPTLVTGLNGSPYNNINTTYYDGAGRIVPNKVVLSGQTTDAYSQGASNLSDNQIASIVSSAISSGRLPLDGNGVYFVLTSADVSKSGFLTQYCGWHTYGTMSNTNVKYSFVGNPGSNSACAVQTSVSPNNNPGADAMASVMAHELEEASTDPNLNAWYDVQGYENADKCAWTFGTTYSVSNGSKANMTLGGLNFLIQRNWVNASGGSCQLKYP